MSRRTPPPPRPARRRRRDGSPAGGAFFGATTTFADEEGDDDETDAWGFRDGARFAFGGDDRDSWSDAYSDVGEVSPRRVHEALFDDGVPFRDDGVVSGKRTRTRPAAHLEAFGARSKPAGLGLLRVDRSAPPSRGPGPGPSARRLALWWERSGFGGIDPEELELDPAVASRRETLRRRVRAERASSRAAREAIAAANDARVAACEAEGRRRAAVEGAAKAALGDVPAWTFLCDPGTFEEGEEDAGVAADGASADGSGRVVARWSDAGLVELLRRRRWARARGLIAPASASVPTLAAVRVVALQSPDAAKGRSRLKRCVLIGDHQQLPPVVKSMAFQVRAAVVTNSVAGECESCVLELVSLGAMI